MRTLSFWIMKNKTALRVYACSHFFSPLIFISPFVPGIVPCKELRLVNGVELGISETGAWFHENSPLEMSVLLGQAYFQVIDLAPKIQECHIADRWDKIKL